MRVSKEKQLKKMVQRINLVTGAETKKDRTHLTEFLSGVMKYEGFGRYH
jgi:hypothetical protein